MGNGILFIVALASLYTLIALGWRFQSRLRLKTQWEAGRAALERGDVEAASRAYAKCVAREPMWAAARSMLAGCLARLGRGDEAEREARLVAEMNPRDPESWRALCMFYALFLPDRLDGVRAAFGEMRRLDPGASAALLRDPAMARLAPHLDGGAPPSGGGSAV